MDIEKTREKLQKELEKLRHEFNVTLPKQVAEAREQGDLKENAGYHAAREQMGFVKGKIVQVSEQLADLNSIDISTIPDDRIGFGSKVRLIDLDTEEKIEYTFVSEGEIDFKNGQITLATPFGHALAGKKVGEDVEVNIPAGTRRFHIHYILTIHGKEYKEND